MNINNNYTYTNLNIEKFLEDYSFYEEAKIYNNIIYSTKTITVTPSKIIYNIPNQKIFNHFQRKLFMYNDNFIKIHIVDEDYKNFRASDLPNNSKLYNFIKQIFLNGITIGFCKYNYIASSNSQLKYLGGWMVNLEGIRAIKNEKQILLKNIFQNNIIFENKINFNSINDENEIYSSFQLYNNCQEILNIF